MPGEEWAVTYRCAFSPRRGCAGFRLAPGRSTGDATRFPRDPLRAGPSARTLGSRAPGGLELSGRPVERSSIVPIRADGQLAALRIDKPPWTPTLFGGSRRGIAEEGDWSCGWGQKLFTRMLGDTP